MISLALGTYSVVHLCLTLPAETYSPYHFLGNFRSAYHCRQDFQSDLDLHQVTDPPMYS